MQVVISPAPCHPRRQHRGRLAAVLGRPKGRDEQGGSPGQRSTSHVDKGVPRVDRSIWEGCSVSYYPHSEKGGRSLPHALEIFTKRRKFILVGPQCLLIRE